MLMRGVMLKGKIDSSWVCKEQEVFSLSLEAAV